MRKSLQEKLKKYDTLKNEWNDLVRKGEENMKCHNGEQADAYFQKAIDMEADLLQSLSNLIRIRDMIIRKEMNNKG
jgi:dsDNA-binding SOS-regulon protein